MACVDKIELLLVKWAPGGYDVAICKDVSCGRGRSVFGLVRGHMATGFNCYLEAAADLYLRTFSSAWMADRGSPLAEKVFLDVFCHRGWRGGVRLPFTRIIGSHDRAQTLAPSDGTCSTGSTIVVVGRCPDITPAEFHDNFVIKSRVGLGRDYRLHDCLAFAEVRYRPNMTDCAIPLGADPAARDTINAVRCMGAEIMQACRASGQMW